MSHFAVIVRVPWDIPLDDLTIHVGDMLLPFKESGCGDEDPPGLKKHLEFFDTEDEMRAEWETNTWDGVKLANGEIISKFDPRLRNPTYNPFAASAVSEWLIPENAERVSMPMKERFPSFEIYASDYCGYRGRDPQKQRFGYWQNPNKRWDWWTIGGRFAKRLPTIQGAVDWCRIADIDHESVNLDAAKRRREFWNSYQRWIAGEEFPPFDGPREKAVDLGFVTCKDANELDGTEWKTFKWPRQIKEGIDRFDVLKKIEIKDLQRLHRGAFAWELYAWAFVHDGQWHEKGRMGWWAAHDGTPESMDEYFKKFDRMLASGNQNDLIVCVDCHI